MQQKTWQLQLQKAYGRKHIVLYKKYADSFPANYKDDHAPETAQTDITRLEKLSLAHPLETVLLYPDHEQHLHLRLYQWQKPIALSDVLPVLENMDLRTLDERSYKITPQKTPPLWISDFNVAYKKSTTLDLPTLTPLFRDAFNLIAHNIAENDGFNRLILGAHLSWREVALLRVYAKYWRQAGLRYSQQYVENTLVNYPDLASALVQLFVVRFDPKHKKNCAETSNALEKNILNKVDAITNLDEDRILRFFLQMIQATVRTNYFLKPHQHALENYFTIKLSSRHLPDLPQPVPLYEMFVYSTRFEAIHLRNTKVARGGIRWSERLEDFRTEILGLMKAQIVKNAVIVPSGAKGGFVLKQLSPNADYALLEQEIMYCYQTFIHALLELTDNIKDHKIIKPSSVVCYDEDDPYLVVAADRGTATFSDMANTIAKEYQFWLGDAFASGGVHGYDHKAMGITARGAWESVIRHFYQFNIDAKTAELTVVGIGDMSGDVFGNGMIYSANVKLVAAFDNRHIFIDPDPIPARAYQERLRLFHLSRSSWADYNAQYLSKGGGIYPRSAKTIVLSPQAKSALGITEDSLTPNALVRAILTAPVDLLWNGGIGTYVKASTETNAEVGDRTNDYCRVNGEELRCKVVAEGGNLGFTQLGRIEYALKGGCINTDFIDNSAGVDCSDHEVNLKILLNSEVARGKLTESKRNQLLHNVTNEVADLVLHDNFEQALVVAYSTFYAKKQMGLHQQYIKELVALGEIDRALEFLPDEKTIVERKSAALGLAAPEICVLLARTKIYVKNAFLQSDLPEDGFFKQMLGLAFPPSLRKTYGPAMQTHILRREIIANEISNTIVNEMGITFFYRMQLEMGASIADIARAQTIASRIFDGPKLRQLVQLLRFKVTVDVQYEMLFQIHTLISVATRWFLQGKRLEGEIADIIHRYRPRIQKLEPEIPHLMVGITKNYLETLAERFLELGLSKELAQDIAVQRAMYTALNPIEIADMYGFDAVQAVKVYFAVGERFNLVWFRDQLALDTRDGNWNALARLSLRDELDLIQRGLTVLILQQGKKQQSVKTMMEAWIANYTKTVTRWEKTLRSLHESGTIDYAMFFVALRELLVVVREG